MVRAEEFEPPTHTRPGHSRLAEGPGVEPAGFHRAPAFEAGCGPRRAAFHSRDGRIRTGGRAAPSRERYQAAPRPDACPEQDSNLRPSDS
jgi:hypothetical protein